MGKIIISIFIYCISFSLFATNYYVSTSTGNDTNDGLSALTAWKTLSRVNDGFHDYEILAGDVVAFRKGDTFKGMLLLSGINGTVSKPILLTSYGIGNKPILTAVQEYDLIWTETTEGSNTWYNTTTNRNPYRLKFNDTEVLGSVRYSELNTNIPDFVKWVYDDDINGTHLYIYSTDSPANHKIEYSYDIERALFITGSSFIDVNNINFQGGRYSAITIESSDNINISNCEIGEMALQGINVAYNSSYATNPDNIVIENNTFDSKWTADYSGTFTDGSDQELRGSRDAIFFAAGENSIIRNNTFKNWGHASVLLTPDGDYKIGEISYNKIYNNYSTTPDIPYGGRIQTTGVNCHHNEFYNNILDNVGVRSQMGGHDNHIHHNIWKNGKSTTIKSYPTGHALSLSTGYSHVYNNIYENNIMVNYPEAGIRIPAGQSDEMIYDNIIRNNITYNCGNDDNMSITFEGDGTYNYSNTIQNNIVYHSSITNTVNYYGTFIDVATFNIKTDHGNTIENQLASDPLFVSATDYHLQSSSPAKNEGITPLSTKDYDGNPIPNNGSLPDIGIYEYYEYTTGSIKANAGSDESICLGESVTLTASGGSAYSWNTGATTQSITVNPNTTTTYMVTVSEGSASDSDSVQVTVNTPPVANAGGDVTITSGQSTTLTASGGDSYQWNTGETTASISVSPEKNTTYSVTVTNTSECEDTDSIIVSVSQDIVTNPPPANAYAGEDVSICSGQNVTLTASGGETYLWDTGSTLQSINVSPTRTTTYTLSATRGGVTNSDQVIVTVDNCSNTNIEDDIIENKLMIYPNPTKGKLNVKLTNTDEAVQLSIVNINGGLIQSERVESINNKIHKQMDLSGLSNGVYIVKLNKISFNEIRKILIY